MTEHKLADPSDARTKPRPSLAATKPWHSRLYYLGIGAMIGVATMAGAGVTVCALDALNAIGQAGAAVVPVSQLMGCGLVAVTGGVLAEECRIRAGKFGLKNLGMMLLGTVLGAAAAKGVNDTLLHVPQAVPPSEIPVPPPAREAILQEHFDDACKNVRIHYKKDREPRLHLPRGCTVLEP